MSEITRQLRRSHRRSMGLLMLAAVALAAAGCGGADNSKPKPQASAAKAEEAGLKFARCMREHGVDVPDPGADGNSTFQVGGAPEKLQAAQQACQKYLRGVMSQAARPSADAQQLQDAALKFARCMRQHGIDFPDPKVGSGGLVQIGGPEVGDPNSPAMRRAQQACQHFLNVATEGDQAQPVP